MRSPPMIYAAAIIVFAALLPPAYAEDPSEASYRLDLQTYRAQLQGLSEGAGWAAPCSGIDELRTRVRNTMSALDREVQAAQQRLEQELRTKENELQARMRGAEGNMNELRRVMAEFSMWLEQLRTDLRERLSKDPLRKLQGDYEDLWHEVEQLRSRAC